MSGITLNAAIKEFTFGYLALRGNETNVDMITGIPATYLQDLYPSLDYPRVTTPFFTLLAATAPGGTLDMTNTVPPLIETFLTGARHLCYSRDYGANLGSPPPAIAHIYLDNANRHTAPLSYMGQWNIDIKTHLNSYAGLLDLGYINEWDTLACYAMETIRLFTLPHIHSGERILTDQEYAWFTDLLTWVTIVYAWYDRAHNVIR